MPLLESIYSILLKSHFSIRDSDRINDNDVYDIKLTMYVAFIGYTILVWDHVITMGDEIRFIWLRKRNLITYLFLLNRYLTPLLFIGNLIAYFSHWSSETCKHFVRYEGASTMIALEVTALIMLIRITALYKGQKKVIYTVVFLLFLETAVMAWLLTNGQPVQHTRGVYACTMIFNPHLHFWPSLSAWIPLLYDTVVIILTLWKCMPPVKQRTASHIVRTLLKDGMVYYSIIFCINFVLAIMIAAATDSIKNITAQLEQLITVAMISRITLSLKREGAREQLGYDPDDEYYHNSLVMCPDAARTLNIIDTSGSRTACPHISVVQLSNRTSLISNGHSRSMATLNATPMYDRQIRRFSCFLSRSQGTVFSSSIGILNVHTAQENNDVERQPTFNVPVVHVPGHAQLSERDAYELRTLRSSSNTRNLLRLS